MKRTEAVVTFALLTTLTTVIAPDLLPAQDNFPALGLSIADYILDQQDAGGAIPDGLGWDCVNLDSTMEYALFGLAAAYEFNRDPRYLNGLAKGIEWLADREEMNDPAWRGSWSLRYHTEVPYAPFPCASDDNIDTRGVSVTSALFVYDLYLHASITGSDTLARRYEANARAALDFILEKNRNADGFFYSCWNLSASDGLWRRWDFCYAADQADVYLGLNAGWLLYGDERYRQAAEHLKANVPASFFSAENERYAWGRHDDGTLETGPAGFSGIFAQGYLPWVFGRGQENLAAYEWMKSCEQPDGRLVCFENDPSYTLTAALTALSAYSIGDPGGTGNLDWIAGLTYDPADGGVRDTGLSDSVKFSNVAGFTSAAFLGRPAFKAPEPAVTAKGDLDENGAIELADVIRCLRMITGKEPDNLTLMDMNDDARGNITDALLIFRLSLALN